MSRFVIVLLALLLPAWSVFAEEKAAPTDLVEFSLADHVHEYAAEEGCSACHLEDSADFLPSVNVCLDCHEQEFLKTVKFTGSKTHGPLWSWNHRQEAKSGVVPCLSCHGEAQKSCVECHKAGFPDELGELGNNMANVHRSEFRVTHPLAARTDPQLCSSCHEPQFCVDCHDDFAPGDLAIESHRRGWSNLVISPAGPAHEQFDDSQCQTCHPESVLPGHQWSSRHGREARKNLVTCQTCHPDGDICLKCHSARAGLMINPHPGDWGDFKDRLRDASNGKTCRKCH